MNTAELQTIIYNEIQRQAADPKKLLWVNSGPLADDEIEIEVEIEIEGPLNIRTLAEEIRDALIDE